MKAEKSCWRQTNLPLFSRKNFPSLGKFAEKGWLDENYPKSIEKTHRHPSKIASDGETECLLKSLGKAVIRATIIHENTELSPFGL